MWSKAYWLRKQQGNKPFSSCLEPHYESEDSCIVLIMKISIIIILQTKLIFIWKALLEVSLSWWGPKQLRNRLFKVVALSLHLPIIQLKVRLKVDNAFMQGSSNAPTSLTLQLESQVYQPFFSLDNWKTIMYFNWLIVSSFQRITTHGVKNNQRRH